ncbi:hypothetical protein O181_116354 [Austropuccinia psidii MF-1]|uniref:Uncharacterized protein n=1 Tax=Austropuccinia psidii MF-1 TaxID=1389203 RepID=A0A9Q3KBB4_9BASI|nr:hypothetical protein [Austropuccinia psidii MF-1]
MLRKFQPVLSTNQSSIPPLSPSSSTAKPAMIPKVRPSPIPQTGNSPMQRARWPIQVTIEDPNMANEGQDAVSRIFRGVDRNSREVIMYANDRTIPGTASEEMASKFAWWKDELINDFQQNIDDLGRDN